MARKRRNDDVTQIENENTEAPVIEPQVNEAQTDEAAPSTENANAESKPICVVPGCGREAKIRGLCPRCGTAARKAIKDGKATWESLELAGLAVAPKHKAFGGEPGLFSKALKNALGGEGS